MSSCSMCGPRRNMLPDICPMPFPFLLPTWRLAFRSFPRTGRLSPIAAAPIASSRTRQSPCCAPTGTGRAGSNRGCPTGERSDSPLKVEQGRTAVLSPDAKTLPTQGRKMVVQLGLHANWRQFTLLVIVNAFVGGMVGLERSIVPLLGQRAFGLASATAVLSFIISFGVVKALANLFAGRLSDRIGRKVVLVVRWLFGLPVPFLIIFAPSWGWVVFANVLLGINQCCC